MLNGDAIMCSLVAATPVKTNVSFLRASQRALENVVWDIVDYHFTVTRGANSCDVAVGIPGDAEDRLSQPELRQLAEAWLRHRLEHGYEPFRRPQSWHSLTQVPFSIVNYWLSNRALPH